MTLTSEEFSNNLREITKKYYQERIKIVNRNMTCAMAGLAISLGSIIGMLYAHNGNPHLKNPVVQQQIAMTETKSALEREKYSLNIPLPYNAEKLQPFLENAFGNKEKRIASLDNAIQIVEADLKTVEQTLEFTAFNAWKEKAFGFSMVIYSAGVLSATYFILRTTRLRNKNNDEETSKITEEVNKYTQNKTECGDEK